MIANGGEWDVEVLTDPSRDLYAQWGLGLASSWWRVFGPVQLAEAYKLGVNEGIWGTGGGGGSGPLSTSSAAAPSSFTGPGDPERRESGDTGTSGSGGNRWQMGGAFAIDEDGIVRWAQYEASASDLPDLKQAKKALEEATRRKKKQKETEMMTATTGKMENAKNGWDTWNEVEQRFVP